MNSRRRGFTLVESVIALLLLTVGMLGAWAMQLAGLRAHGDSAQHAAAAGLLGDMAARVRANATAGAAYGSDIDEKGAPACDASAPCTPAELAAADLAQFAQRAGRMFPGEQTRVTVQYAPATGPATADAFTLRVSWRGARDVDSVTLHLLAPPVAG